ncbi:hypothetical protein RAA17_25270 [Komagataeibacter rhaeticus]|nr:hypothetical protein [Komagataeibacter rhaeticus]
MAERGGCGDEAGAFANTVDRDRPRVGPVLIPLLEALRDAARHQVEPRADPLVIVPEFDRLGEIERPGRERPRLGSLYSFGEGLDVGHALGDRESLDLGAVQILEGHDAEWGVLILALCRLLSRDRIFPLGRGHLVGCFHRRIPPHVGPA